MMNILIHGCNGKMGQTVAEAATTDPDIKVIAGVDKYPDSKVNTFPVYSSFSEIKEKADVIIDFSISSALPNLLDYAVKTKTPIVIATTGLSDDNLELIEAKSKEIAIFRSANMSIGVNLMYELTKKTASVLGEAFDIEIIEKHHNQKIDSPSGTAYAIADAINSAYLNSMHYTYGRHSKHQKRSKNEIGIHSIRGGTIAGEHTVIFAGDNEVLEITHSAQSRHIFAVGAIAAASHIKDASPGLYDMHDVMLKESTVTNIYADNEQVLIGIKNLPFETGAFNNIIHRLSDEGINIDMISQTLPENNTLSISLTIPIHDLNKATEMIEDYKIDNPKAEISIIDNMTKLTIEGLGMERHHGVASDVFDILAKQHIKIHVITTSETKIALLIDQKDEKAAAESIINHFKL